MLCNICAYEPTWENTGKRDPIKSQEIQIGQCKGDNIPLARIGMQIYVNGSGRLVKLDGCVHFVMRREN